MTIIRWGFALAALYGLVATGSLYFGPPLADASLMRFAFAGAAGTTQLLYALIATDPVRWRPLMPIGILSKLSFAIPAALVAARTQASTGLATAAAIDAVLATFFAVAFVATGQAERRQRS